MNFLDGGWEAVQEAMKFPVEPRHPARWWRYLLVVLLIPLAIVSSLAFTVFLSKHGIVLRRMIEPCAVFLIFLLVTAITGFLAPAWKLSLAGFAAMFGGWLSWYVVPWFDPLTLRPTALPFCAVLLGGILGLAVTALLRRRSSRVSGR